MLEFNKNRIDTLSDVFCAWMGGIPENDNDIKYFLSRYEKLASFLTHRDIEHIVHFHAFFPKETVRAVYTVIPPRVKLSNGKSFAVFEKKFEKMNSFEAKNPNGRAINVKMSALYSIYVTGYIEKAEFMRKNSSKFRSANDRILFPDKQKERYRLKRLSMTEDELEEYRKKGRDAMRKRRAEHPENKKIEADKMREKRKNRTDLQIIRDRITSRINNRTYRKNNREQIRARNNAARERLKQENPELLKERDKKTNTHPHRKEICRNYYQKHKEEINQRARNNPKVKEYKRKYALKKRWQEKTGAPVLSLLQAIVDYKQRGK